MSRTVSSDSLLSDYFVLMKPRVMALALFTAWVGYVLAPGQPHGVFALASVLLIALGAGGAGALNMWFEADLDRKMSRTRTRPVAARRITPEAAREFGVVISLAAAYGLGILVNWFAAALLAFTIVFYAVVYTMWLKPATAQNIVIGGLAGALPPLIGWVAAGGSWAWMPALLCLIIFLWTPPHFWALALLYQDDYARANLPILPNVAGVSATKRQIVVYSVLTSLAGFTPALTGLVGFVSIVVAALGGVVFVGLAVNLWLSGEKQTDLAVPARRLFFGSIVYLFALFSAFWADAILGAAL